MTPTLPRYRQWCQTTHRHEMLADPQGDWLRLADVMAWEEQAEAAAQAHRANQDAKIARLQASTNIMIRDWCEVERQLDQAGFHEFDEGGEPVGVFAQVEALLTKLAWWQAHGVLY